MKLDMSSYRGNKDALKLLKKINLTVKQQRFIRSRLADYILFSNKKKIGYCTSCNTSFSGKFKHNESVKCPHCKRILMCKSEGMIYDKQARYTLQFQKHKDGVIAYVTEIYRVIPKYALDDLLQINNIKEDLAIIALYDFSYEKQTGYMNWAYGGWGKMTVPAGWPMALQSEYVAVDKENAKAVIDKTGLKYVREWIEIELRGPGNYPAGLLRRLALAIKHPQIEFLYKMGFTSLLYEKLCKSKNYRAINWKAKTPLDLLRLTKQELNMIKKYNPSHQDLAILQRARKDGNPIRSIEELEDIKCTIPFDFVDKRFGGTTLKKIYNYRKKQPSVEVEYTWWRDYHDYLSIAEELGYDITDSYYLFPKNMMAAHDKVVSELNKQKRAAEKEKDQRFTENIIKKYGYMTYENEELLIRPAINRDEYDNEGRVLHHCVATYYRKAADGRCAIFLIRKKREQDKPYYTLELNPKKEMVQCRGERNCSMTEEVQAFVDEWLKFIKKKPKREKEAA